MARQTQNQNGIAVKCGIWMKQNIVVHLSGYGYLQSEISLMYQHELKKKNISIFPRWSRDVVS